jgi:serine/threonine-protein kinase HipA
MNRCPITYEECGFQKYSNAGLKLLSPSLKSLADFPYTAEAQRIEAVKRVTKMSIQGVQPKLSVNLNVRKSLFEIADKGGCYIIKPQHHIYRQLPENESLTMRLAGIAGIEVPLNGLVYCEDGTFSYFIRRFDRVASGGKLAVEDFAQLSGMDRETKYDSSMEKLADITEKYCTFPVLDNILLFHRCIFNYLVGNEDMHLKNFSLITRDGKVEMAPAYDFSSTTVAYLDIGKKAGEIEEVSLPLKGRKKKLSKSLWLSYYGKDRLNLRDETISEILGKFKDAIPKWKGAIGNSFLSESQKKIFLHLLENRCRIMGL